MNIGGFQPFTLSDYPGYCAAIVFTIGCNFCCEYCHNKTLLNDNAAQISETKIFEFLQDKHKKLDGLVISGGEPTLQHDLQFFIQRVKELGFKVKLDTNGSRPEILETLITNKLVDYIAMDIKAPLHKYHKLADTPMNIAHIKHSINILTNSGIDHLFRTTWYKKLLTNSDVDAIKNLLPKNSTFVLQECRI